MRLIFFIVLGLVSLSGCDTCKYVSKHPECFPADTVYKNSEKIKYIEKIIKQDSIVIDTVPCINDTAIIYRKVYVTKTVTKIDTIYTDKYVSKINPANVQLQKDYDKLKSKSDKHKAKAKLYIKVMICLIIICVILLFILFR